MTTRYQKRHYEDVAGILADEKRLQETSGRAKAVPVGSSVLNLIYTFAALFATDNLPTCIDCGAHRGEAQCESGHLFAGGFNRDQFLAACGLESEG